MADSNTAIAKRPSQQSVQANRPDFLTTPELGPRGFQEMETKDMVLPRLALCQAMTRQRQKSNPNYIPGLEEGQFFNTLTGEIYGDKVHVIPLFFYKSRIFFKDLDQGGGIICQAPDGKSCQLNNGGPCIHAKWGANGEPPECTEFFNYPSLMLRDDGKLQLIVVSLKSTGMKAAKPWNSKMRLRGADMFSGVYIIEAKTAKNKAGQEYYEYVIDNAELQGGWVDKEQYAYAQNEYAVTYEGIRSGAMTVDQEGLNEDLRAQAQAEM